MVKIITAPDTELIKRIYALYSAELARYTATPEHFRERLMLDCGAVIVIDEADSLLRGFAIVYRDGLLMLLVERSCRLQGVGARLLAECERLAAPCGRLMLGHGSSGRYLYCGALVQSELFPPELPDLTDDMSRFLIRAVILTAGRLLTACLSCPSSTRAISNAVISRSELGEMTSATRRIDSAISSRTGARTTATPAS